MEKNGAPVVEGSEETEERLCSYTLTARGEAFKDISENYVSTCGHAGSVITGSFIRKVEMCFTMCWM